VEIDEMHLYIISIKATAIAVDRAGERFIGGVLGGCGTATEQ